MTWFEILTGFPEQSPDQVRANVVVDGETMTSVVNGRQMVCGRLETPTLGDLRLSVRNLHLPTGVLRLSEVVADVQRLHADPEHGGALFQVASQFNLLEMVSPSVTPEEGVGIYENDRTQGPACAVACGAGTIYRNYFAVVNGQVGQSAGNQINCLQDMGEQLNNSKGRLWAMRNGYALASMEGLREISERLFAAGEVERDELRQQLRIGIQWHVQVTLDKCAHLVSQAYCSALPVAYSPHSGELWADFARLVLEASYEATFHAAVLNRMENGNGRLFLTLLGGGAFGNHDQWILSAIRRCLRRFRDFPLDVAIVSYGTSNPVVRELIRDLR